MKTDFTNWRILLLYFLEVAIALFAIFCLLSERIKVSDTIDLLILIIIFSALINQPLVKYFRSMRGNVKK